ncbi:MAG TPA: glycosyltransferase family 2 protein [Syntrophaceae bacterium]|nr:glycosyltransferase family 2 protein [Syntrophaceae bacterium]
MESLSVTIITYNEGKDIRDCLESVKWADEIIIVDSFSTDKTVDICEEYTDKIYKEEWKGYASQKNSAIDKAKSDWILSIDADEKVPNPLKEEIFSVLSSPNKKEGYFIARKNFFCGRWIKHGGWYPDYTMRLFRKGKGRFPVREVHESAVVTGATGYLTNPLEHYTYQSVSDFLQRMNQYSSLSAQEYFHKGKRAKLIQIIFGPIFTFIRMYIIQRGFLDGYLGLLLSVLYSYYTFTKYAKLKELVDSHSPG